MLINIIVKGNLKFLNIICYIKLKLYYDFSLEKLNDITTTEYSRGTNRKEGYMNQLLMKRTRLEHYRIHFLSQIKESTRVIEKKKRNKIVFFTNRSFWNR